MSMFMSDTILLVDDDANVLEGYKRQLRNDFTLETAVGAEEGLKLVAERGPFAVVVSDLQMPGMDGIRFLTQVREQSRESVRILLTGNTNLDSAIQAINQGQIFRFLTKPCPPDLLASAFTAALQQHKLITAERELLEQTLSGSVGVLCDMLSFANPEAFGRSSRITRSVESIAERLQLPDPWVTTTAAMLSQLGCVILPEIVLSKVYRGDPLTKEEPQLYKQHPFMGADLVAAIPRMKPVAEIIRHQDKPYGTPMVSDDSHTGDVIPMGARILKVALDFDALLAAGKSQAEASAQLKEQKDQYDPKVLDALIAILSEDVKFEVKSIEVAELRDGMILVEDIHSNQGELLASKGQEVTQSMRIRLQSLTNSTPIQEPFLVMLPKAMSHQQSDTGEQVMRRFSQNLKAS